MTVTAAFTTRGNLTVSTTPAGLSLVSQIDVTGNPMMSRDTTGASAEHGYKRDELCSAFDGDGGDADFVVQLCSGFVADVGDRVEWDVFERHDCAGDGHVGGGHGVRSVRVFADGQVEPHVAAACAWSVSGLDDLCVRRHRADGVGDGSGWGVEDFVFVYSGADVTVTDAAGKGKTFTTDPLGNLTVVKETDPVNGAVTTTYSYTVLNQLATVSMPRGGTTQQRSFTYAAAGSGGVNPIYGVGPYLVSATNPENGTVTSNYSGGLLQYKTDAKGQAIVYNYDSYKRVTQISKYPTGYSQYGTNIEDVCQRVNYYYDTNPDDANYSQYALGRLTAIHYAGANCQYVAPSVGRTAVSGNNYIEMFSYTPAGDITNKKLRLWKQVGNSSYSSITFADLEAVYSYTSEGKINTLQYPLGTTYQFTYDAMGRPTKMTDTSIAQDLVSSVTYGPAGELLGMTGTQVNESRTYNVNGQLTQIVGLGMNIKYNYAAAGANNGQIASQQDVLSGETVTYAYDSLKRLASATSTQGWNQNFGYDGFGNLTSKTGNGIAPLANYAVDPVTNRLTGSGNGSDLNGNITTMNGGSLNYDVANRMTSTFGMIAGQGAYYEYDIGNQRIYQSKQAWDNNLGWVQQSEEWYFYGITGQKLGTYRAVLTGSTLSWSVASAQVFFGPKLLSRAGGGVVQEDVRGSIGTYYPYGEDRSGTGGTDQVKFATYTRDSVTGLDYASQRYHLPGVGRFGSPDPYGGSARAGEPGSWNRFAYVGGDPIDGVDPTGEIDYAGNLTAFNLALLSPQQMCAISPMYSSCYAYSMNAIANMLMSMNMPKRPSAFDLAKSLLKKIETGDFMSKPKCAAFFQALVTLNGLSIDAATLAKEVVTTATDTDTRNLIYDGPSDQLKLNPTDFPGTTSPKGTVSSWFGADAGREALSQYTGSAIWLNFSNWTGGIFSSSYEGSYGLGTLLHELLHKESVDGGFNHDQMSAALTAAGASGDFTLGHNPNSDRLARICF